MKYYKRIHHAFSAHETTPKLSAPIGSEILVPGTGCSVSTAGGASAGQTSAAGLEASRALAEKGWYSVYYDPEKQKGSP